MPNIDTQAERDLFAGTTQGRWVAAPMTSKKARRSNATYYKVTERGNIVASGLTKEDAEHISCAHNIYPALLAEIDKGRAEREEMQVLAREIMRRSGGFLTQEHYDHLRLIAGEGGQNER